MIYRGSWDGFKAKDFHGKCDNKGATLIIVKSEERGSRIQRIFGAYTDIQWTSDKDFITGHGNSFLFVLRDDMNLIKLRCTNKEREVYHSEDYLCCFGDDLCIGDDCNMNYDS